MSTAKRVVEKFGGQSALAALIGKRQSTVQYWVKSGTIPAKWQGELLKLAQEHGTDLTPTDFVRDVVREPMVIEVNAERIPVAKWFGALDLSEDTDVPCYVLGDGRRVISRTGATDVLTERRGGGNLESYINVGALKEYIPADFPTRMVEFSIPEVVNKTVLGIGAEDFLEICRAYVKARDDGALRTKRQIDIAIKAGMFLSACAKVGLIALIDEATGYQYDRAQDALKLKLRLFLEEEMRQWEKTFPDELWVEFGRLTNWKGSITKRPKYWGKLVMELIYSYLDKDVAQWLRDNAPKPRHRQNYHQWLTSQYGLKKLLEHIWMLIGMARACHNMDELRERMGIVYGRHRVQLSLFLPLPSSSISFAPDTGTPEKKPGENSQQKEVEG